MYKFKIKTHSHLKQKLSDLENYKPVFSTENANQMFASLAPGGIYSFKPGFKVSLYLDNSRLVGSVDICRNTAFTEGGEKVEEMLFEKQLVSFGFESPVFDDPRILRVQKPVEGGKS